MRTRRILTMGLGLVEAHRLSADQSGPEVGR